MLLYPTVTILDSTKGNAMISKKIPSLLAACALLASAAPQAAEAEAPAMSVSMIQLIGNPDQYHGKRVFLSAYATVEPENMSLCMTQKAASPKDCLWLEIAPGPYETESDSARFKDALKKWKRYNRKLISIHGTFDKNDTGHLGGWSGAIKDIGQIQSR
jgi:hypothetical protein